MNEPPRPELSEVSPDQLLVGFTRSRFVLWLMLAAAIHAGVIGLFSIGYIRDTWIDPEGAEARRAAATQRTPAAAPPASLPARPEAPASAEGVASNAVISRPGVASGPDEEARILETRKDTPVVRRLLETPKPEEVPREPAEEGIPLNATSVR